MLYGGALAVLVRAGLGLDPWNVLHQGISRHTGLSLGTVTVLGSLVVLAAFVPLRQRAGLGTLANALLVGPILDAALTVVPPAHALPTRLAYLTVAVVGVAVATGLYVGAGYGPGPRDGLMTGLANRGIPLYAGRAAIEISVLTAGWLLGGSVGPTTIVFAAVIGPLVNLTLPRLTVARSPRPPVAVGDRLRGRSVCVLVLGGPSGRRSGGWGLRHVALECDDGVGDGGSLITGAGGSATRGVEPHDLPAVEIELQRGQRLLRGGEDGVRVSPRPGRDGGVGDDQE